MKTVIIALITVAFLAAASASHARGLEGVEVALSIGRLQGDTSRDFITGGTEVRDDLEDGAIFLGRIGYLLYRDALGIEASLSGSTNNIDFRVGGSAGEKGADAIMFDAGPFLQFNARRFSTFVNVGVGFSNFDANVAGDTTEFALAFGGGVKYRLFDKIGLRLDIRDHVVFLNDEGFWGAGAEDNFHLLEISGGVFYRF
jgi:opacity protein-like surface antigen